MTSDPEKRRFREAIRARGLRLTSTRLALFDEVFAQHGHLDAEALLAAMQPRGLAISRASVYRNLDLLVAMGLVRKQRLGRNRFLYEHVHEGLHHDHLVCRECGRVVEFVSPGISALQSEICRAHGFAPERPTLQILGLCNRCAAVDATAPAAAPAAGGSP